MTGTKRPPIEYMARTREWYLALGYDNPYQWAHHDRRAVCEAWQTAQPGHRRTCHHRRSLSAGQGRTRPRCAYNGEAKFFSVWSKPVTPAPDVRISHIAYDRKHTSARDANCWFPLRELKDAAARGDIGAIAPRVHGFPTNRSQRTNVEVDAPALLAAVRKDGADAAILVPNCPVCHQSVSLAARHLEANGIATVIMGCAKDIVEHCGVPRFVFSDFPLGNAAGRPCDRTSQRLTMALALDLLETATGPRTTLTSPLEWSPDHAWKLDYSNPARVPPDELARKRAEFDRVKQEARRSAASTGK
jgi:D-proline reductase (dithiol) PrdB